MGRAAAGSPRRARRGARHDRHHRMPPLRPVFAALRMDQGRGRHARAIAAPPYILMCTRFTSVVHFEGQDRVFRLYDKSEPQSVTDLRFATWQRDVEDFAEFVALTKEISAAYPDLDVIVRPHPSENAVFYQHAFAPFRNVAVTNSGSVLDWIRPAELVVHCNCTTGVEAVLAGRRALNMRPNATPRSDLDKEVAKEAGVNASSVRDALEKIEALLRAPAPRKSGRRKRRRY